MKQYPEYILKKLRQRRDFDENNTEIDDTLNKYSPNKAFREVCE